ncbi:RBBP9/YdeN family alpha/beta hydrolase [Pseudomonas sp.]|uniref:RBBP9/YdeN family alpha/beta hydrolase n=1 Tax=Pseudomonas sp. TaxID=306 RepID=UPI00272C3226|nr:alpha/beta hydrolase [Pseudomonas sp.]
MSSELVRYLIIPGWQGSGPDHWQSHWHRTLPNATRVEQRDWLWPQLPDWVQALDREISIDDRPVVLIAHSLGCITVAHWAAQASARSLLQIRAALLVAPADVERATCPLPLRNFAPIPRTALPFPSLLIGSDNDRAASAERAVELANVWGSTAVILGGAGHINTDTGFHRWDEGFGFLYRLQHIAVQRRRRSA